MPSLKISPESISCGTCGAEAGSPCFERLGRLQMSADMAGWFHAKRYLELPAMVGAELEQLLERFDLADDAKVRLLGKLVSWLT